MLYANKTRDELVAICKERRINGFSGKTVSQITSLLQNTVTPIKFVDFFCGIGGFRYGIQAFQQLHPEYSFTCVKSVDIKKHALQTYSLNFGEKIDACNIKTLTELSPFDLLCAGFPCQPFSSAGKKEGLEDKTRGNLIYDVLRICKKYAPRYIVLENVSNIENIEEGDTLRLIVSEFEAIGYHITVTMINSSDVGLAQDRKRIFIIGSRDKKPVIDIEKKKQKQVSQTIKDIIDTSDTISALPSDFLKNILEIPLDTILGKSIKDKRGGEDNIHSWDIHYYGPVNDRQVGLLNQLLKERRKKKWAVDKKITWMDGMPLTLAEIKTFMDYPAIHTDLEDLVSKGYLVMEHPRDIVDGKRQEKLDVPAGYNINKGKLSFPISKVMHPDSLSPTLTATDSSKLAVAVGGTIRQLNFVELKRICGFPEDMRLPPGVNMYDLFGNMVCPPVMTAILGGLLP